MRCAVVSLILMIVLAVPVDGKNIAACLAHKAKRLITKPYRMAKGLLRAVEIGYIYCVDNKAYWLIPYLQWERENDQESRDCCSPTDESGSSSGSELPP